MKKLGKTTRPYRYDLNKIPYDYTVEVRNRFKGLVLIDRVPDELWNEVRDIVQLFVRPPQTAILLFCIFHGDGLDPCLLDNVTNLIP